MIYNPWTKIRQLEAALLASESARLKLEDDNRMMYADMRESRALYVQQSERTQDWMAGLLNKPSIHGNDKPKPAPVEPVRRPITQGSDLERMYMEETERTLGIN